MKLKFKGLKDRYITKIIMTTYQELLIILPKTFLYNFIQFYCVTMERERWNKFKFNGKII